MRLVSKRAKYANTIYKFTNVAQQRHKNTDIQTKKMFHSSPYPPPKKNNLAPPLSTGRAASSMDMALLDVAYPGLLLKPLDATIGQLFTPYCPSGRQGDNQQNDDEKYIYFAGHFDGHRDAPVRYREHRLMEEVQGFPKSH